MKKVKNKKTLYTVLGIVLSFAIVIIVVQAVAQIGKSIKLSSYSPESIEYKLIDARMSLEGMTAIAYMEKDNRIYIVIHKNGDNYVKGAGLVFIVEENGTLRYSKDSYGMFPSNSDYIDRASIFKENDEYIFEFRLVYDRISKEIPFEVKDLELYDQDGNKLDKVMIEEENDGAFFYVTDEIGDDFKIVAKYGDDEDIVFVKEDFAVYEQLRGN